MNGIIKKYTSYATLIFALFLWVKSLCLKIMTSYDAISYVQRVVFKQICTAENIMIESVLIVSVFYALLTFVAVVLGCTALTSILHEKPLIKSLRISLYKYFGFFCFLPLLLVSLSWEDFVLPHLPAKAPNLIAKIIEIKPVLEFVEQSNDTTLYLTVLCSIILILLFAYGVGVLSNIWFNRACGLLGLIFYGYYVLYITTSYVEYSVWFLLFILLCYMPLGAAIVLCRRKEEEPLVPKYELFILSLDDDE